MMAQSFYKATVSKDKEFFGDTDSVEDPVFSKPPLTVKLTKNRKFELKTHVRRDISYFRNKEEIVSREIVRNSILGSEQVTLNLGDQKQFILERSSTQDNF